MLIRVNKAVASLIVLGALLLCSGNVQAENDDLVFGEVVSDYELSETRGAFTPEQLGIANYDANLSSNNINSSATGQNNISTDAFGNSNGVFNVVQNSGNGVVIQNSTIINLTLVK